MASTRPARPDPRPVSARHYARSRIVGASRAVHISAPIDGATPTDDLDKLRDGTTVGDDRQTLPLPHHTDIINDALSPFTQELAWAVTILSTLHRRDPAPSADRAGSPRAGTGNG
ncbi:hypothetical protein ACWEK5_41385 [Rhodococcus koreensis]